ncbi:MAG: hypothetical protein KF802_02030 [Bdellovibrionaceae bacterium]|nr:hypothetical protein [Pseudobdellovibrionaceae bacterium]MBX3033904.1 hypothetical protein [Pseudobdellovibrionaceae bacterium]
MIFFSGLVVALVLGLFIRGLINPSKVRQQVENAAVRIHPDVRVSFEDARISLADGFLPRLAVVVSRVRMESNNSCWMSPRLLADEIVLPLSVPAWLSGRAPWQTVEAGEVELRLTATRPAACENTESLPGKTEESPAAGPVSVVSIVRREQKPSLAASGDMERLRIRRLTLVSEVYPEGSVDLNDFEFHVRSSQPRVYQVKARTHGFRDEGQVDSLSMTNMELEYKEFPERLLDMRFFGHWREGAYTLQGRYSLETRELHAAADLRHLPLSQLLILVRRLGGRAVDFNPRQSWLSLKADINGPLDKLKEAPVVLRELRLEGDLGDLSAEQLVIERLYPLKFAPSRLDIRSLDLDRLLQFLQRSHPSPVLNKVGRFTGVLDVQDDQNFLLSGEHSGLEFIFANQGQREIQTVNRLHGRVRRDKGRWLIGVDRAEFDRGEFLGEARLESSPDFHDSELRLKIERLVLAPAVQKVMTRNGEIGPLQGHLQARLRDGVPERLKGALKWSHLTMEGARLRGLQMQFDETAGDIVLSPHLDLLEFGADSTAWKIIEPILTPETREGGAAALKELSGQFRFRNFNKISWNRVIAHLEKPSGVLTADGGWEPTGQLRGQVQLRSKDRVQRWSVEGTRDEPRLVEERK